MAFGPFDRDCFEAHFADELDVMVQAVFTAMTRVLSDATVTAGAQAGVALYPFPTSVSGGRQA